jgi:hypothetical protein
MNILNKISIKQILLISLFVFSGIYVFSLFFATVNGDEAALAEQSWWLNKIGYVKSTLMDGMGIGWEDRQYHHHKFFVLTGAFIYKFLGSSLYIFRAVSYIFFLLTAFLIHSYIKKQEAAYSKNATMICILILLINATMLEFGMISRPETMVMALGFISFYLLNRGIAENKNIFFYPAATFAGLSGFTHLNGLSFIFAGFVLLLMNKKYLHAIGFGFIGTLFALLYFYDLTTAAELQSFWVQFTADPNLEKTDFKLYTPLVKIANEQMRFFWNQNMAAFSISLLVSLVLFWKSLRQKQFNLLVYFIALVIGLASVSHGKTIKYGLLYFPYIALIITFAISNMAEITSIKKRILLGAFSLFLLVNTFSIIKYLSTFKDSIGRVEMISNYLPQKNVNVMACEYFYFYGWNNYRIHSYLAFELKFDKYEKRPATASDFYTFAEARNNHYVILDQYVNTQAILKLIDFKSIKEGQSYYNYSVIKRGADFAVLELNTKRTGLKNE